MTTPTETAIDQSGFPFQLALLPYEGNLYLLRWDGEAGAWLIFRTEPYAYIPDLPDLNLIHLQPVDTTTPDDIVKQFREQLGIKDGDDVD